MKAPVTWVLRANSGVASIVANRGTAKGFTEVPTMSWDAAPPVDYADRAGTVRPGDNYKKTDPKDLAEEQFARLIAGNLDRALQKGSFDRLILCAAPHMLGTLRRHLSENLHKLVIAEVAKDLTQTPLASLPNKLSDVIAA